MINLSVKFEPISTLQKPIAVKVVFDQSNSQNEFSNIILRNNLDGNSEYFFEGAKLVFKEKVTLEAGEVVLLFPDTNVLQRFYRPSANHNSILLTEQCDQLCMMCSQPPKNRDYLHWDLYLSALKLVPEGAVFGITGGEPTLFKQELFSFMLTAISQDPSIQFHVLTNGQHFESHDKGQLTKLSENVLWGVPLYSVSNERHDHIVGKVEAFKTLEKNFGVLLSSGSRVELRTVILKDNYLQLHRMAKFITKHFSWVEVWSLMQLEFAGFAKIDWQTKFVDTSEYQDILWDVHANCRARNVNVNYYNFPLCTLPEAMRPYAPKSISDWKNKYLDCCSECSQLESCAGFFEWYTEEDGFKNVGAI